MDLFQKILLNRGPLGKHADVAHGYFAFPKLEGEIGPRMKFRGKELLNWSLNNYIGLANHPEVRMADSSAAQQYGLAHPMGARMMSGNSDLIEAFEKQLSDFVKKEDSMILNYGYQGMMSIIDALVDRHDVVVYDSQSHACILDGVRLHQGKRFVFQHNDIESLRTQLNRANRLIEKNTQGSVLVITEGVFGMAGDMGNLKEIVALKTEYNFRLLVDDAHGFGTMGKTGAGAGEAQDVEDGIDIYFSTFAKSMASIGGFVASSAQVIEYLRYNTRSQIFAKTLPTSFVLGNMKRLELLRSRPELRENLWKIVNALQSGLKEKGFNIGITNSPVTPVFLKGGEPEAALITMDLRENYGIFCSIVIYPVVPKDVVMLRLIPTAEHTLEDVKLTIKAFSEIGQKLEAGIYSHNKSAVVI